MHKTVLIIYSIPMLFMLCLIIRKNLLSFIKGLSLLTTKSKVYNDIDYNLYEKLNRICLFANINMPVVRIINSPNINAETRNFGFPIFRNVLVITRGALNSLDNKGELDFLLAHEIWHIKRHNFLRKILCIFSDFTLFGNGFLAVLQNSFKLEQDADDFAIEWLVESNMQKNAVKSLFEKQEEIDIANRLKMIFPHSQNTLNFASLKDNSNRRNLLKIYEESNRWGKFIINLKFFYQIYFGEAILTYLHPLNSDRISRIQNM